MGDRAEIAIWAAASPFLPHALRAIQEAGVPYVVLPGEPGAADLAPAPAPDAMNDGCADDTTTLLAAVPELRLV
jgi:D-3-phosphoglycerate dehydrogenase